MFKKIKFINIIIFFLGIFVMGLGSAIIYEAGLGTNSIGTFVDGVHYIIGVSRGIANTIVCIAFIIPAYFFAREFFGIGTFISMFAIGLFIDLWKLILNLFLINSVPAIVLFFIGIIINSIGAGLYIAANVGISSYDAFVMIIFKVTNLQYKYAKVLTDFLMILLGFIMSGVVGIGTIISAFLSGFLVQYAIRIISKYLKKKSPV